MVVSCVVLAASLGSVGFGPPVMTDGGYPPLRLDPERVQAVSRLAQPPPLSAAAAMVVDLDSGQILYSLHPHESLAPASTVKIMTALVVLQRGSLDDQVKVSANAASAQGSRMGLIPGETVTVRDLLYGLLLPSGNDAAVALAEHVAGSEAAFVTLMNTTASALGLRETHFTSAHGLDDPAETIGAADLVTLTRAALAYPAFAQIVATPAAQVAGRTLTNTNQLLGAYRGADGVKTGTTDAAGECLVASVTRDGHRLLVAVLGSKDRYADAKALLDYAFAGWHWRTLDLPDDALAWEIGSDGRPYRLRAAQTQDIFLPAWQWSLARPVRSLDPAVPLTSTLPVGTLTLTLSNQALAQVRLGVWEGP